MELSLFPSRLSGIAEEAVMSGMNWGKGILWLGGLIGVLLAQAERTVGQSAGRI